MTHDDLVKGENCFFCATGVTDGDVLRGVRYEGARGAITESLVMRSRSGHGPPHRVPPRPHEAARAHGVPAGMKGGRSSRSGRARLPPRVQRRLSGRPPIIVDGQRLEADVQLMLALREWLGAPVWDEQPDRRARAAG